MGNQEALAAERALPAATASSAPMISREVDKILAEFHGEMFDLSSAAKEFGDPLSEAMAAYIHDRFCIVRCKLHREEPPADLSPYPRFARAALAKAEPTS